ncbi:ABC transporter permease [Parapedobacter tibetensis]|uniref:ABC transporter permease n=1 Tax=Parapedobacter tibetensis TaxID=2972951 RepID=UPI00214D697A|nr:FtsX-like permease family protein [Parapedobacter tibetensis]
MNHFKIAWRGLLRSKVFTVLNITGLALGFAGFILSYQYINRETGYDKWNPNYDHIYLVGLTYQGQFTDQTPPSLANRIKVQLPEAVDAGRMLNMSTWGWGTLPLFGDEVAVINNGKVVDKGLARIMAIEATNLDMADTAFGNIRLVDAKTFQTLFPNEDRTIFEPRNVAIMGAHAGQYETIHGVAKKRKLSLVDSDFMFVEGEVGEEQGAELDNPRLYQTYIQLHPQADVQQVSEKINQLYKRDVAPHQFTISSAFAAGEIYLDPLANLHLRPKHGSNAGYLAIWILGVLSAVILALAAFNFANLMVALANKRAKEVGIKKIFGVSRKRLALQFFSEVFIQCLLSAIIAWWLVVLAHNGLQKWFDYELGDSISNRLMLWQLLAATVVTTVVSGAYPAIILSGFRSVQVLKGNFQTSHRMQGLRNGLLTFQFTIAVIFLTSLLVLSRQLDYIQTSDKGFEPAQVINAPIWGQYLSVHEPTRDLRARLTQFPEIQYVAATTDPPGSPTPPPMKTFMHGDAAKEMQHIGVDGEYFETLGIAVVEGNAFAAISSRDTSNLAIINESALKALDFTQPLGSKISGCGVDFTIVGVVKDSKINGFESIVRPTVYTQQNECGDARYRHAVMVKTVPGTTRRALEILKREWERNKMAEGIPFSYEFLDQQYAALHAQQNRLQSALGGFTILSIVIAMMGLFSMSAYSISIRQKEMSIRKVLGASISQLFLQLNRPFFRLFVLAGLIAFPLAYLLINQWLSTFAYRIDIQWWMFAVTGVCMVVIILLTVTYQSLRTAKTNPADILKDE